MPIALLALTISAFAIGTTEFVIVGLIPPIVADFGVILPSAGLLVSLYAFGVAVGTALLMPESLPEIAEFVLPRFRMASCMKRRITDALSRS